MRKKSLKSFSDIIEFLKSSPKTRRVIGKDGTAIVMVENWDGSIPKDSEAFYLDSMPDSVNGETTPLAKYFEDGKPSNKAFADAFGTSFFHGEELK